MCAGAGTSVGNRLTLKSSTQEGISADGSLLSFSEDSCPSFPELVSSLRPNTESEDERAAALFPDARDASGPNHSGDGVVEDELLSELTDNTGTTRGTEFVCLAETFFHFWLIVALDR